MPTNLAFIDFDTTGLSPGKKGSNRFSSQLSGSSWPASFAGGNFAVEHGCDLFLKTIIANDAARIGVVADTLKQRFFQYVHQ